MALLQTSTPHPALASATKLLAVKHAYLNSLSFNSTKTLASASAHRSLPFSVLESKNGTEKSAPVLALKLRPALPHTRSTHSPAVALLALFQPFAHSLASSAMVVQNGTIRPVAALVTSHHSAKDKPNSTLTRNLALVSATLKRPFAQRIHFYLTTLQTSAIASAILMPQFVNSISLNGLSMMLLVHAFAQRKLLPKDAQLIDLTLTEVFALVDVNLVKINVQAQLLTTMPLTASASATQHKKSA